MAESFSPALPGDVEWLPGPDGSRVLRLQAAAGDPPALVLRLAGGGERRIEARAAEYVIPRELDWTAAWLQWPDGTQVVLPLPHGRHAEVIELHPRRFAPTEEAPTPDGGVHGDARQRRSAGAVAARNGAGRSLRRTRLDDAAATPGLLAGGRGGVAGAR